MTFLANNRKVWQRLRDLFPSPYLLEHADAWIELNSGPATPTSYAITVLRASLPSAALELEEAHQAAISADGSGDHLFVGCISITPGTDVHACTAEMGYFLGEPFWGMGIMTSANRQMVHLVFRDFPRILRIFAEPYASNDASRRVLVKTGFQLEGILRSHAIKDDVVEDVAMYSILRSEFEPLNC